MKHYCEAWSCGRDQEVYERFTRDLRDVEEEE